VIQVDVQWRRSKTADKDKLVLVFNGQLIEDSWASRGSLYFLKERLIREDDPEASKGFYKLKAGVCDVAVVTSLLQCNLDEIDDHFEELSLLLPEAPHEDFKKVQIICGFNREDGAEARTLHFRFPFGDEVQHWTKPWSITDFASTMGRIIEDRKVSGLHCYSYMHGPAVIQDQDPDYPILGDFSLQVVPHTPEATVQQVLRYWLPIIKDVCEEAETILVTSIRKEALVALFQFAPEVKTACEQYLLYFVQFLEDLGIQATVDLQEQVRGVLFTVTPKNGTEALERIREALDVYLQIPRSPDFDAEVTRHTDIAVLQYAANVQHLRSQLMLAQAVLESKNATIEALQAANLQYKQLLSANPQSQGQLPSQRTDDTQRDETVLGGAVTLTKYTWKGVQVNLPFIFRELRRRFKREG
jgi:hypothetical protein